MNDTINPVDSGAIVYHDAHRIKGISFVPDATLEGFEKFIISIEQASKFIQGEYRINDWCVKQGKLVNEAKLQLTSETSFSRLEDDRSDHLHLNICIYPHRIIFDTNGQTQISSKSIPFLFTKQDDPSVVLHTITVSLAEMNNRGHIDLPFPISNRNFDIYTKKLFPAYRIDFASSTDDIKLHLPRHFVDLMKFNRKPTDKPHLQAILNHAERLLTFKLIGDAQETYSRSMEHLRLLFTLPDDASMILHADTIPISELRDGISIKIPDVVQRTFDLWAPLLYRHMSILEIT